MSDCYEDARLLSPASQVQAGDSRRGQLPNRERDSHSTELQDQGHGHISKIRAVMATVESNASVAVSITFKAEKPGENLRHFFAFYNMKVLAAVKFSGKRAGGIAVKESGNWMTPEQLQAIISQCTRPDQSQQENSPPSTPLPAPQPINPNLFPALNPLQMAGIFQQMLLQKQMNQFNLAALFQTPFSLQALSPVLIQNQTRTSNSNTPNSPEDTANDSGFDSPASNLSSTNYGALTPLMQSLLLQTPLTQSAGSAFTSLRCHSTQSNSSSIFSDDLQQSVKTALNTSVQAPDSTPILARKGRKDYCKVCETNIFKNGARSQGPRRHVLQHHLKRAYFLCTLCEFGSNYDKAHVHSHARRMHPNADCKSVAIELPRWVFEKEEKLWMETCFGDDSDGRVSEELLTMMAIDKSEAIRKAKAEAIRGETHIERDATSPFSSSSLQTPASDKEEEIKPDVQSLIKGLFNRTNV